MYFGENISIWFIFVHGTQFVESGGKESITIKPIFHCNAKPFALGPRVALDPQCHNSALGIPTCWYLKTLKFALPPTRTLKFALPSTPTLNPSRWNIGGFGPPTQGAGISHVHFVLISFANANPVSSGIWAYGLIRTNEK